MTTLVILSDTHGNKGAIHKLLQIFEESDYIIHLGDCAPDMKDIAKLYPQKTFSCVGNCDFSAGDSEHVLEVEGHKIFMCHGHRYSVKTDLEKLKLRAKELGCDIALYGHTHQKEIVQEDGIWLINPGNMTFYSCEKSYCYLCIHEEKVVATLVDVS